MISRTASSSPRIARGVLAAGFAAAVAGVIGCGHEYRDYREERRVRVYSPAPPPPPEVYDPAPAPPPPGPVVIDEPPPTEVVTEYDTELSPYGRWVQVSDYGRCWVPEHRRAGWQPYTVGHWVHTEDGWAWVAEEDEASWGEVTYHYGRWYDDRSYGWVWIPGTTWAPAWVAWREGDGYCGWAPLPPRARFGETVSVVEIDREIPADRYCFVEERYIGEPRVYQHVTRNNVTFINRTTNITNITYVNNRVVNRGVPIDHVQRFTGRRVETVRMAEATNAADARRFHQEGRPVRYVPPQIARYEQERRAQVERAPRQREAAVERQRRELPRSEDRPGRPDRQPQLAGQNLPGEQGARVPQEQPAERPQARRAAERAAAAAEEQRRQGAAAPVDRSEERQQARRAAAEEQRRQAGNAPPAERPQARRAPADRANERPQAPPAEERRQVGGVQRDVQPPDQGNPQRRQAPEDRRQQQRSPDEKSNANATDADRPAPQGSDRHQGNDRRNGQDQRNNAPPASG